MKINKLTLLAFLPILFFSKIALSDPLTNSIERVESPKKTTPKKVAKHSDLNPSPFGGLDDFGSIINTKKTATSSYKVQPGDTAFGIAQNLNMDVNSLLALNSINDPSSLKAGEVLKTVGAITPPESTNKSSTKNNNNNGNSAPLIRTISNIESLNTQISSASTPSKNAIFIWPIKGNIISSFTSQGPMLNDGINIKPNATSQVEVVSAGDGKVLYVGNKIPSYGNLIIIKHKNNYITVYAHNKNNYVQRGDIVTAGQKIASVGDTGKAQVLQLHFEIRKNGVAINPIPLLK